MRAESLTHDPFSTSEVHDVDKKTTLPDPAIGWPQSDAEYESLLLQVHII